MLLTGGATSRPSATLTTLVKRAGFLSADREQAARSVAPQGEPIARSPARLNGREARGAETLRGVSGPRGRASRRLIDTPWRGRMAARNRRPMPSAWEEAGQRGLPRSTNRPLGGKSPWEHPSDARIKHPVGPCGIRWSRTRKPNGPWPRPSALGPATRLGEKRQAGRGVRMTHANLQRG